MDKNVLSFEELFKKWKLEFSKNYIKELKKEYSINEDLKEIYYYYKKNRIKFEYLKNFKTS